MRLLQQLHNTNKHNLKLRKIKIMKFTFSLRHQDRTSNLKMKKSNISKLMIHTEYIKINDVIIINILE